MCSWKNDLRDLHKLKNTYNLKYTCTVLYVLCVYGSDTFM